MSLSVFLAGLPSGPAAAPSDLGIASPMCIPLLVLLLTVLFLWLHLRRTRRGVTALREGERRYRNLIEDMQEIVWELEPDGRIRYVSPRCESVLGYRPEELLGKPGASLLASEEVPRVEAALAALRSRREPSSFLETTFLAKDGRRVPVEISSHPSFSREGAFLGCRGLVRDVTERRKAFEALWESESRFARVFTAAPVSMTISRIEDGRILELNDAFTGTLGYTRDEAAGRTFAELGLFRDPGDAGRIAEEIRRDGVICNREIVLRRRDGSAAAGLLSADVIVLGEERFLLSSQADITELKEAEKALQESEERLHLAFQGSNDGFWDWDIATGSVEYSRRWKEMLGYGLEEIAPRLESWEGLIHPDDRSSVTEKLREHLEGRMPQYESEHRLRMKSGDWKWVLDRGRVSARDPQGKPLRMTGTQTDISERMQALQALRRRIEFERLVIAISARFVKQGPEGIDSAIRDALAEIGRFCRADRSHVFLLSGDLQALDNAYEWCAPGIDPLMDMHHGIPVSRLPWFLSRLRVLESIAMSRLDDLPIEAAGERSFLEARGVRSALVVPMCAGKTLIGFLGLDAVASEKSPSDDGEALLRLVGEIFASALERKRAETTVQESRRRYRAIVEDQTELISRFLPDGTLTFVNEVFCRYFKRNREEFLGRPFLGLLPADDAAALEARLAGLSAENPVCRSEHRVNLPGGEERWLERTDRAICDAAGRPAEIQSVGRDVTERKRATEELLDAKAQIEATAEELGQALRESEEHRREADVAKARAEVLAEEAKAASKAKGFFLASMSHEIRTPLSAILGYADMLQDPSRDPEGRAGLLVQLRLNAQHLLAIVNDILDLSKIEAGQMDLHLQDVPLVAAIHEVAALARTLAAGKGLGFRLICEGPVPPTVRTDPVRLKQILINLASNAVKFTDRGGVTIRLRTEPGGEGVRHLCVSVEDTGIGIEPDKLGTIFTPFTQVHPPERRYGGTGLGLDLSRRLARALDGSIAAASEPGVGSVFTFRMPVAAGDPASWTEIPESFSLSGAVAEGRDPSPRLDGARVLLVEDGYDNQRIIRYFLENAGARVDVTENGALCLERVNAARKSDRPFDVILMDLELPILDGRTATRELRRQGVDTPIIALTAYAMPEDRERCLSAGCTGYLSKPVVPRTLIEAVRAQIRPMATGTAARPALSTGSASPGLIDGTGRFRELVREFLEGLPGAAEELKASRRAGNAGKIARLAHRLRGSGGMYGFIPLGEAAGACEDAWRKGEGEADRDRKLEGLLEVIEDCAHGAEAVPAP